MPYLLDGLKINRVDLVDEGANSAAFIELYKRKEQVANMDFEELISKLKPEHATVVSEALEKAKEEAVSEVQSKLDLANEELAKANSELETLKANLPCECDGEADDAGVCTVCHKAKPKQQSCKKEDDLAFDEEETIKSMPEAARELLSKVKAQRDAAEEELRKAKEAEEHAVAVAKAAELKALPIESEKLVGLVKSASPEMVEALTSINAAIESTVLNEVGKNNTKSEHSGAWEKIEAAAAEIAKRDDITKEAAVAKAIKEQPDLYNEYLQGGMN